MPPRLAWRMDGKPLGRGLCWNGCRPGRHTLELVDAQGLVLDTVRFEVRGAGWRRGRPRHRLEAPR